VELAPNFAQRSANWLHPGNHNHLRITRILKCLMILGLQEEAQAFFECLRKIHVQQRGQITARTFQFWEAAVNAA
jgi:hypothetical protein